MGHKKMFSICFLILISVTECYKYKNWRPIWDIYPVKDEEGFTRYTIPFIRHTGGKWPWWGDKALRESMKLISSDVCVDFKEIEDPSQN